MKREITVDSISALAQVFDEERVTRRKEYDDAIELNKEHKGSYTQKQIAGLQGQAKAADFAYAIVRDTTIASGPLKRFIVGGRTVGFPIEMLRQDRCWPAEKEDSEHIQASYGDRSGRARRWQVMLVSVNQDAPDIAAWRSYGIDVISQETRHEGRDSTED